jgi:hypothetical protein
VEPADEKKVRDALEKLQFSRTSESVERLGSRVVWTDGLCEFAQNEVDVLSSKCSGWEPERQIRVEDVTVDSEEIYVMAQAPTAVCEAIVAKLIHVLERGKALQVPVSEKMRAYATDTSVEADFAFEDMLSSGFAAFLSDHLGTKLKGPDDTQVIIHPYDFSCKLHRWRGIDRKRDEFNVSHVAFEDYDRHIFRIYTPFDYTAHVDLLEQLERSLRRDS